MRRPIPGALSRWIAIAMAGIMAIACGGPVSSHDIPSDGGTVHTGGSGPSTGTAGGSGGTADGGGPSSGTIGAACTQPSDCAEGLCLGAETLPGGYCSKICGGQVISKGEACPVGAACVQVSEAASACLDLCGQAYGGCRTDYACAGEPGASVCVPRCKSDRDCDETMGCNSVTGLCEPGIRQPGHVGAACTTPVDCVSNACLTEADSNGEFPGGYCLGACTAAMQNRSCPGNDGICLGLPQTDGTSVFACFGACTTGVDCRSQYICSADAQIRTADGFGVCIPRCGPSSCAAGYSCDSSVGLCVQGSSTASTATVQRQDLGSASLGPADVDFKTVSLHVPDGAVSFSLTAAPIMQGIWVKPVKVTAPNGQVLFDLFDPLKTAFKTDSTSSGAYAMLFPNAPRLTLVPGNYEVVLGSAQTADVKLDVLYKSQDGVPQGGSLPIVFWFTKQPYVDATTAQSNTRFQDAISTFSQIYASIGIRVGPFSYVDLAGTAAQSYAVIESVDQLPELFAQANASNEKALHFFFIDHFNLTGGAGAGILGISGGIPGPPAFPGLPHGGVAVALSVATDANLAETMAHEGGHYLGLFHTTERAGTSFDPLIDTPECPASADKNGDQIVDAEECASLGGDNLMFWISSSTPQRKLTPDQRFVVLRNPSVQ